MDTLFSRFYQNTGQLHANKKNETLENDSMEELLKQLAGDIENNPDMEEKLQHEEKRELCFQKCCLNYHEYIYYFFGKHMF